MSEKKRTSGGSMPFTEGQKAKIVEMPPTGAHLIGAIVTVGKVGPFGESGDVFVSTADGFRFFVHETQLVPIS